MLQYHLTSQNLVSTETNINERVKYTASIGMVLINTANSNTDGTGTMSTVITGAPAPATNGTFVESLFIKGIATNARDTIRLFIFDGGSTTLLIDEIEIPGTSQDSVSEAFEISYDLDLSLQSGYSLMASTQTGDDYIITAFGLDRSYP